MDRRSILNPSNHEVSIIVFKINMDTMSNKILLVVLISFISYNAYSQNNHSISLQYGLISSELVRSTSLAGGGSYSNNDSYELGFRFNYGLSNKLSIETGLDYFSSTVEISSEFPGIETREETLRLFTIPILVKYAFNSHYFANGGILLNIQDTENSFDKQSGIGLSIGFGRLFYINDFYLILNPKIDLNAIIPFSKENYVSRY